MKIRREIKRILTVILVCACFLATAAAESVLTEREPETGFGGLQEQGTEPAEEAAAEPAEEAAEGTAEEAAEELPEQENLPGTEEPLPVGSGPEEETPEASIPVLDCTKCTLGVGDSLLLTADRPVTWKSSKASVISVAADGTIRAKKAGTATITACSESGGKTSCRVTVKRMAKKVTLSAKQAKLGVGEELILKAKFPSGTAALVTWSSSDPAVADVREGRCLACGTGTAVITAALRTGKKAVCTVTVCPAPEKILLNAEELTLGIKESNTPGGSFFPADAAGSVKWSSSDPGVASVGSSGKITGKKTGTAEIRVTAYNGVTAVISVKIVPAPSKVSLNKTSLTLGKGETFALLPVLPEGTHASVKFSSSYPKRVSVSADGVVTAKAAGTAWITVKTHNGKTARCKVTVKAAPGGLKLSQQLLALVPGQTAALTATYRGWCNTLSWSSSDPEKVIADASGDLTALALTDAEPVTVTVSAYNGIKAECTVYVYPSLDAIGADEAEVTLGAGMDHRVELWAVSGGEWIVPRPGMLSCTSSAPDVAEMDAEGRITARAPGIALITVTSFDGKTAQVTIRVCPVPTQITLDRSKARISPTGSVQLGWKILPADAMTELTFTSSDPSVASVDGNGLISALAFGTATITVRSHNGIGSSCLVTVGTCYRALVIGNTYAGTSSELEGPERDSHAVANMLDTMGATPYEVRLLEGVGKNGITQAVERTFADATQYDVSLFYFSGHGDSAGKLVTQEEGGTKGYVTPTELRELLDTVPGKKIVILDCCYSGAFINKAAARDGGMLAAAASGEDPEAFTSAVISAFSGGMPSGAKLKSYLTSSDYTVLVSSTRSQTSLSVKVKVSDGEAVYVGLMTYCLCGGSGFNELTYKRTKKMSADTNGDKAVSLIEGYDYVIKLIDDFGYSDRQSTQYYAEDPDRILWGRDQ